MKTKSTTEPATDSILREVWRLKDENAATYGYDIDAIAAAARRHQEAHPQLVVRRAATDAEQIADGKPVKTHS